ncbi:MAG: hypothetical protein JOZ80_02375 [Acidobacteriaceae bacterium]|nr:hypothetical protein [Acidobacteriaceae bacterium]
MKTRIVTIALFVLIGGLLSQASATTSTTDGDVYVSAQAETGSDGSFNIDAICPKGKKVITGGFEILSGPSPNAVLLSSDTFHFHGEVADGWQVIGFALSNSTPTVIRVIASCTCAKEKTE